MWPPDELKKHDDKVSNRNCGHVGDLSAQDYGASEARADSRDKLLPSPLPIVNVNLPQAAQ